MSCQLLFQAAPIDAGPILLVPNSTKQSSQHINGSVEAPSKNLYLSKTELADLRC